VESMMEEQPSSDFSNFHEACRAACEARSPELRDMNVSFYVDMRALGAKISSPSTCCLLEALEDRKRLLSARQAGDQHFTDELLRVLTAQRENVYKQRQQCLEKAERFTRRLLEEVRARRKAQEQRKVGIKERRLRLAEQTRQRRQRRQQRRHSSLTNLWQVAAQVAERRLSRWLRRRRWQVERELKAMRAEDLRSRRVQSLAHRSTALAQKRERQKRQALSSTKRLRHLTFAEQQALGAGLRQEKKKRTSALRRG
ncbi:unnamed protein product, partial [Effrenium voratum]